MASLDERQTRKSVLLSWQQLMAKLGGDDAQRRRKAIVLNNHTKRLDLMRDADGICSISVLR